MPVGPYFSNVNANSSKQTTKEFNLFYNTNNFQNKLFIK